MISFIKKRSVYFSIAVFSTLIFLFLTVQFRNYRSQIEDLREKNIAFETLETLDAILQDAKMKIRGEYSPSPQVALIAIDDESIREVGRWPWDRQVIAQLLDNVLSFEPKAVGLDVIFSEPQTFDQGIGDEALRVVIEKHQARLILGTFANLSNEQKSSYQDYCMNEAFISNNGEVISKLNPNLILIDDDVKYESLNLQNYFQNLFKSLNQLNQERFLSERGLKIEDLTLSQNHYLKQYLASERENYCRLWLTEKDPFLDDSIKDNNLKLLKDDFVNSKISTKEADVVDAIRLFKRESFFHPIPESGNWTANIEALQNAALYSANFNAYLDHDGKVRRMPLVYRTGNRLGLSFVPSLALQTYLVGHNYRAEVGIKQNNQTSKAISTFKIIDQDSDKELQNIPVDLQGRVKINFYGPTYSVAHIPARELLNSAPKMQIIIRQKETDSEVWSTKLKTVDKKEFLKDSLLIVGATAVGVYDLRNTPLEKNFPGPEIHTHLLSNLQEGAFLQFWKNEPQYVYLIALFFVFIYIILFSFTGAVASSGVFVGAFLLILMGDYALYITQKSTVSSTIIVLIFSVLLYFILLTYKFLTEEKNKKELKGTFAKYVSPAIVDEILKSPEKINLGGEKKEVSVFFSDVRGFTTLSEKLDPQKLSDVLNYYLTPMTNVILEENGTLDKYIGDAIMAFFGAPLPDPDHAIHACQTALIHVEKLKLIQVELKKQGIEEFDIGIGINCGEVSVGNMGSNLVRNYTVMGDAVNLASRLEGITKTYGVRIVVSEFVYAKVKEHFILRKLDQVRVKGKNQPIQIYELLDFKIKKENYSEWLESYNIALDFYFQRDFDKSFEKFNQLLDLKPNDPVAAMYIERLSQYKSNPPDSDWDGVFDMKTK